MPDAASPPSSIPAVLIIKVGPRDGLQNVARTLSTAHKLAWITALHAAGLREIEVGSFVPAARLPPLAGTAELVRHARSLPGEPQYGQTPAASLPLGFCDADGRAPASIDLRAAAAGTLA